MRESTRAVRRASEGVCGHEISRLRAFGASLEMTVGGGSGASLEMTAGGACRAAVGATAGAARKAGTASRSSRVMVG